MDHTKSSKAFTEASYVIPGGVNSPVRAFQSVDHVPIFVDHAKGSRITDIDGNSYIDYICSWGPLILGHSSDLLLKDIQSVMEQGISFGLPTCQETELAELIVDAYDGVDMVRMVNSGTEATMSAIRVARAFTKRDSIIKFEGCYHGHNDALLVKSGSGALTFHVPTSPGVPADTIKHTYVCRYNDIESVKTVVKQHPQEIAAVIIEPVAGNMGLIPADLQFLKGLRELCSEAGTVLIFDEVISGFRCGYHGASGEYQVIPDMVCFGKIIGGGLPAGAYGGRRDIMKMVSPSGPVYQAGTLSGNPLAMYMGIKQLSYLKAHQEVYEKLNQRGEELAQGMRNILMRYELPFQIQQKGSLLCLFFCNHVIRSYDDVADCDTNLYQIYFSSMLEQGILLAPSQFEVMFLSYAHTKADIVSTLTAFEIAMQKVKQQL